MSGCRTSSFWAAVPPVLQPRWRRHKVAPAAQVIVLERNPKPGKKLLATGNGRCNLDNTGIAPELYFTADPAALRRAAGRREHRRPAGAGSVRWGFTPAPTRRAGCIRTPIRRRTCWPCWSTTLRSTMCSCAPAAPCSTLSQSRSGYAVQFETAEGSTETLRADAVICAMGGEAGPQFGTDGFGTRFAAQCGGRVAPLYPCLTALQCAKPSKALAGIRAKAAAIPAGRCPCACLRERARYSSPITAFPASASCSCPACWPRAAAPRLLLWSWTSSRQWTKPHLPALFAAHAAQTAGRQRR